MALHNFWEDLVRDGLIQGDASYYSEGRASGAEYANAIQVAFEATDPNSAERKEFVDRLVQGGVIQGDAAYWYDKDAESNAGADFSNLGQAADDFFSDSAGKIDVTTATEAALPDDDIIDPIGKTAEFPGIMAGGIIHRIDNVDGQQDFFVVAYEYPEGSGHSFYYRFSSVEALEQAIGPNMGGGKVPIADGTMTEDELTKWTDGGNSNEIEGVQGSFKGFIDDITRDAGIEAGIEDPSLVGKALADPDIALIMSKASQGDWSKERIKAALRNTTYYKDVLYPGIENFYGQSNNPEAEYAMYKQNVEASLKRLGITPDPQGGYGSQLAKLLDAGVSDAAFGTFATVYQQAQTNVGFAGALSKWTEKFTGTAISSFEDYFDVLAGNSPAEVLEIAEVAGLQYMAENQGFVISDEELKLLSEGTDLDQGQAGQLFSQTARDLLSLGERGLRKGGLTSNQILEAEAGIGGNPEKIKLLMSKLAREEGLSDDPTASIFTDFNREGSPIKKGLGANISEGA